MKNKKTFLLFTCLFFINLLNAQNWVDTLYSIETVEDVSYGNAIDFAGADKTLYMDISYPIGDNIPECGRPLLVMVHGGAWIGGDKAGGYSQRIRQDFAKRGYTTASVNYRLGQFHTDQAIHCNIDGWDCFNVTDSSEFYRANHRGIQDVNGAIRCLVNNADSYDINPDNIFLVGESAGGYIAMGVGFIDDSTEVLSNLIASYPDAPAPNAIYENACIQGLGLAPSIASMDLSRPALGGMEGTLNYPANSSYKIRAVGNFYGGAFNNIFQTFNAEAPALYLYHQPCDLIVPYNYGRVLAGYVNCLLGFPANCAYIPNRPYSYGSFGIKRLIDTMEMNEVPTPMYLFDNTSYNFNCLQQALDPNLACHAIDNYSLRTNNMATFFADKVTPCIIIGVTQNEISNINFHIYPNPVGAKQAIAIKGAFKTGDKVTIFDISGKSIYEKNITKHLNQLNINMSNQQLRSGVYFIQISSQHTVETQKILVVDGEK